MKFVYIFIDVHVFFSFTNLSYFAKSLNDAKGNRINKFNLSYFAK